MLFLRNDSRLDLAASLTNRIGIDNFALNLCWSDEFSTAVLSTTKHWAANARMHSIGVTSGHGTGQIGGVAQNTIISDSLV